MSIEKHLTRNVSRIRRNVGNGSVLMGTQCININVPTFPLPILLCLEYSMKLNKNKFFLLRQREEKRKESIVETASFSFLITDLKLLLNKTRLNKR